MPRAQTITFLINDNVGRTSSASVNVDPGTTLADVEAFTETMGGLISNIIAGRLYGAKLTIDLGDVVNPGNANPNADTFSDVQEKALFLFETSEGFSTRISIPAIDESEIITPGTPFVDVGNPPVDAFVAAMTAGITPTENPSLSTTVQPTDVRGDDILVLDTAYETYTNRRRPRS